MKPFTNIEIECRGEDDWIVWCERDGQKYLRCFETKAGATRYMNRLPRQQQAVAAPLKISARISNQGTGTAARVAAAKAAYAVTRDHRAATRAYCAGSKWATENAKAVSNW